MMLAAMTIDEVDPPFGESLEGVYFVGINDVIDDAGNHFDVLHRSFKDVRGRTFWDLGFSMSP